MAHTRRFLIASSFSRLVERQFGTQGQVLEGYFSHSSERSHLVRVDPASASLVLVVRNELGHTQEEITAVSRAQAEALLEVAPDRIAYDRSTLALAPGVEGALERVSTPYRLALLGVSFASTTEADAFQPPLWAGPEVSGDPSFDKGSLARVGPPAMVDPEVSSAALEALLDLLDTHPRAAEAAELTQLAAE